MMTSEWIRPLVCLALVAGGPGAHAPKPAVGEFCGSEEFRDAFLEGQQGIIIDDTRPSRTLIAGGNRALPCLKAIAEDGGAVFGIEGCVESTCRTWALWAIRLIGTAEARSYLVHYLERSTEPELTITVVQAVASLQEPAARPALLRLLHHEDPQVRLRCIVALGVMGSRDDLAAMVDATKTLPESMIAGAVHGFRMLGDERGMSALQGLAERVEDDTARDNAKRELEAWRLATREEERLLTTLLSGTGWALIEAVRQVQEPVAPDIRDAVLMLLDHDDPHVRAESVVAVGKMHRQADFERLLSITLALPEPYVPVAAHGLELLNDERAIAPLERHAVGMKNDSRKQALLGIVERLRRAPKIAAENRSELGRDSSN